MEFAIAHTNFNVFDLEKSLQFYTEALGLREARRVQPAHGKFIIVYLADAAGEYLLELTWLADQDTPYDLGDNEIHVAFRTNEYDAAYQKHKEMGVICYENPEMGIYFINDPDGYWLEIVPVR